MKEDEEEDVPQEKEEVLDSNIFKSNIKDISSNTDARYDEISGNITTLLFDVLGNKERKGFEEGIVGEIDRLARRPNTGRLPITKKAIELTGKVMDLDDRYRTLIKLVCQSNENFILLFKKAIGHMNKLEDNIVKLEKTKEDTQEKQEDEQDENAPILEERKKEISDRYLACDTWQKYISLLNSKSGLKKNETKFVKELEKEQGKFKGKSGIEEYNRKQRYTKDILGNETETPKEDLRVPETPKGDTPSIHSPKNDEEKDWLGQ